MKKATILHTATTADGFKLVIKKEQNYKLAVFIKYVVYVYSMTDSKVIIYCKPFTKEHEAITHSTGLNVIDELRKHTKEQLQ